MSIKTEVKDVAEVPGEEEAGEEEDGDFKVVTETAEGGKRNRRRIVTS